MLGIAPEDDMTNLDLMIYRLACGMAAADGELSTNEATILEVLAKSLGLSAEETGSLAAEAEKIDYTALRRLFPEPQQRDRLFETAALMAMADGRSDVEEWRLATRLAEALGFDRARVQQRLEAARARLRELAAEHDLAPEIRANLARQGIE